MENLYAIFKKSTGVVTDSRLELNGSIFVCINGENYNANKFAQEAIDKGALFVVLDDENYFDSSNEKMHLVQDSVTFLQELAFHHRQQFDIPVIGITGSNGKTTTKELLHAVLSQSYNTLATKGNLNNHLGVPFTLLELNEQHEMAIIEMGANKPGDIAELCEIACPTHGIISNIGKAHLEGFKNIEGVTTTKKGLYDYIEKTDGHIIVNGEDELLLSIMPKHNVVASYGEKNQTINGELTELNPFVNFRWSKETYTSPVIASKLVGKYNFYNFLAAICFGSLFDVPEEKINQAISEYQPTNNRSQVKKTNSNTLILDCYNANPSSMSNAIESFNQMNVDNSNKLAILGAMKEMGKVSDIEHQKVVDLVLEKKIPTILVGEEYNSTKKEGILSSFSTVEEMLENFNFDEIKQKSILLKGSRSIYLEKLENKF